MPIVVLAKAVPRSEELRVDGARRAALRDGVDLVLNPLDQRAVRAALELRTAEEPVVVVSLGPPSAVPALRELRALGVDRVVHLCDPAFAGSDLLASSAALSAAVRRLGGELVLVGDRSTDSDTGLLGPEVAGRLDRPIVTAARALRRSGRGELEVVHDTAHGHATSVVRLPAVVGVGEKLGRPLRVDPAALAQVGAAALEREGPEELGLGMAEVGGFASPTRVESLEPFAPHRAGLRFADGSVDERVAAAVRALSGRLARRAPPPAPLPWPAAYDPAREVAVLVTGPSGAPAPGAAGLVSQLRRSLGAHTVLALACGDRPSEEETSRLAAAGARAGLLLRLPPPYDSRDAARALAAWLPARPRLAALLLPADRHGREVAGQVAALRQLGAVGDALEARVAPEGELAWTKPSFGGELRAVIRCRSRPAVVTVSPDDAAPATDGRADPPFRWSEAPAPAAELRVRTGAEVDEPTLGPDPATSEVVVAVGAGVGGADEIRALGPTLARWGAALVASRRVVDAGLLPARTQLGLTGRSLAPRLAVLLGVRGSPNHMVGWRRAGTVLSVNRDPEAPVFAASDLGIVGELAEVLPRLVAPVALALAAGP